MLVVNTASKCGFTPQFAGLEKLYKDLKGQYGDKFEIIGFPCNQFGGQDPGSNDQIQEFCQLNYGVSFPVLGKIDVCTCGPFLDLSPFLPDSNTWPEGESGQTQIRKVNTILMCSYRSMATTQTLPSNGLRMKSPALWG